ncbi:ComEA family DNA-binding protein [Mycolicibacterium brumae]|uniref:Helix-hairpin-helix DNA-binding motif class 1 domain-containing protein n=1 Tax=Mycolicibacterium brumae TaxID=85968 RepID=A0A2G5P5U4_9MYCO|nr:ComEA family DNA-binding protein [Mycolicibacterium brumae]MCV7191535.1 helix-hairpin-helix domain-containing protein [Mycolicibacterium brumae]PIB73637.1 hypothetical protein CQY22_015960 [Mycolicibacterium brumae]RWA16250.1 hypothetical protein MBRU_09070 [Mycolicibacterium brumae DSM 44177]UWW09357.1 helix-hairpin-helix domain-containing protein [Mycolicibacterium brumae]
MAEDTEERVRRRLGLTESADTDDADPDEDARSLLPRWLPETSAGGEGWLAGLRADPGRAGMLALGAVGVLAVLVTVFTLVRDDTPPVASANLPPVASVSTAVTTIASAPPTAEADAPVVVSVVGLVNTPGLVTLEPGARVADALEAAGGVLGPADTAGLNLARHLADGEQVLVGIAAPPGAPATLGSSVGDTGASDPTGAAPETPPGAKSPPGAKAPPGQTATAQNGPVNLNTATIEELDALPGVGPVTAGAIVSWREANGNFTSVDQLAAVDGIGPARLARLRELVAV